MDYASFLRQRITELRMKRNVSEYQMSLELGQNKNYIQGISSGKALPSMTQFFNICDYFCNGVQREHNKKLNNGLPILHKVPPKRDYGRYFCIMVEKGGTSHGGLTEKLSPFFHAQKQEVNAYGK